MATNQLSLYKLNKSVISIWISLVSRYNDPAYLQITCIIHWIRKLLKYGLFIKKYRCLFLTDSASRYITSSNLFLQKKT